MMKTLALLVCLATACSEGSSYDGFRDAKEPAVEGEHGPGEGAPDLAITLVSSLPAAPQEGEPIVFSVRMINLGDGPTPMGAALRVAVEDADGKVLGAHGVASPLAAGGLLEVALSVNPVTAQGVHSLYVTVDAEEKIAESDETNNRFPFALKVAPVRILPSNAVPASRFIDSIGINTHFAFNETRYATHYAQVKARLVELGVLHIRDGSTASPSSLFAGTPVNARFNDLAASGIRLDLIGHVSWTGGDIRNVFDANQAALEWMEGQNEADIFVNGDWVSKNRRFQQLLWSTVKGSGFHAVPVLAPSLTRSAHYVILGDLAAHGEFGNIHPYPGGQRPLDVLDAWMGDVAATAKGLPVVATETGYHSALGTASSHLPISDRGKAKYIPRLLLDYFNRGIQRTYLYQLYDHVAPSASDPEANFGLVRYDFSVRPAFTSLKNMIAVLKDTRSNVPGGMLNYTLTGSTSGVRSALFQKTNGRFYLALWRDISVWSTRTQTDIDNGSAPVLLSLDAARTIRIYQPGMSALAQATFTTASLTVQVPDEVLILEIEGA